MKRFLTPLGRPGRYFSALDMPSSALRLDFSAPRETSGGFDWNSEHLERLRAHSIRDRVDSN